MARSTREAILTAAAELMRHKGYGAVGMKDIAAASGAPIGSLYHHFRGGKVQIEEIQGLQVFFEEKMHRAEVTQGVDYLGPDTDFLGKLAVYCQNIEGLGKFAKLTIVVAQVAHRDALAAPVAQLACDF